MKLGKLSTSQLISTKTGNIGLFLLGVYFCLVNFVLVGAIDYPNVIMGLTFIGCAILYAKASPLVLSGVLVGFMGVANLLAIGNVLPIDTAWMITGVCAALVFVFEIAGVGFGKSSAQARVAVVIPMLSLFFMFVLAIIGWNPALYVDWGVNPVKFINYVALMFLTGLLSFQFLGWNLLKTNQGLWISVLGLLCVVISFFGVYQGTLSW